MSKSLHVKAETRRLKIADLVILLVHYRFQEHEQHLHLRVKGISCVFFIVCLRNHLTTSKQFLEM